MSLCDLHCSTTELLSPSDGPTCTLLLRSLQVPSSLSRRLAFAAGASQQVDLSGADQLNPPHISTDKSVKYDYDIVYVRAPRKGDDVGTNWTEFSNPLFMDAGADLMLLHPDGSEEVLVAGGDGLGHRSVRLLRRRMGLLLALPRPEEATRSHGRAGRRRHLQDPRQDRGRSSG